MALPGSAPRIDVGRLHAMRRDDRRASLSSGAGASPTPTSDHAHPLYSPWQLDSSSQKINVVNDRADVLSSRIERGHPLTRLHTSTHNRRTMSHTTNGRGRTPVSDDRRPTMHDVADLAGVSLKTVSRVFNHEPNVRPAVRARVESAAVSLGFRRNIIAKNLRTGSATSSCRAGHRRPAQPVLRGHRDSRRGGRQPARGDDDPRQLGRGRHPRAADRDRPAGRARRRPHRGPDRRRPQLSRTAAPARRPRRVRRPAGKRDRGRRGRPRQRRRGAIGDPPPAEPRPSPDRLRRRLGDPGDGAGAAGRLSAGPRRGRGRVRSGARPVRCAADRAGRDRRPAAARERRPADRDLRREQPQLHRRHPGGQPPSADRSASSASTTSSWPTCSPHP